MATNYDDSYRLGIKKEVNGERRYFTYDGSVLLGEITFDISGQVKDERYYIFVPRSYYPLEMVILENNEWKAYAYHNDHLMTPLRLTDENQQTVWQAEYEAFGEVNIKIENVVNNLRFPGQWKDLKKAFLYNRYRYYLPEISRYNRLDPLFQKMYIGITSYIYASNNPTIYLDESGLKCKYTPWIKIPTIPVIYETKRVEKRRKMCWSRGINVLCWCGWIKDTGTKYFYKQIWKSWRIKYCDCPPDVEVEIRTEERKFNELKWDPSIYPNPRNCSYFTVRTWGVLRSVFDIERGDDCACPEPK